MLFLLFETNGSFIASFGSLFVNSLLDTIKVTKSTDAKQEWMMEEWNATVWIM